MKLHSLVLAGTLLVSNAANSVNIPTLADLKNFGSNAQAFVSDKKFVVGATTGAVIATLATYCIKKHFKPKSRVAARKTQS